MIRILVAEDEAPARRHLVRLLGEFPGVSVVGEAEDGHEALRLVPALRPDALFTDIRMPGLDGLELLQLLPAPRPAVVFTTAHVDHALEAIEGGVAHYLVKPVTRVKVGAALARIRPANDPLQREWLRIPVRRKGGTGLLRPQEVEALVADLGDCVAWTSEGPQRVDGALAHWEERLKDHRFFRVNRHILVNLVAVREVLDSDEVILPSGSLPVSRRRMDGLRGLLGLSR